jgi:hypothetical protein
MIRKLSAVLTAALLAACSTTAAHAETEKQQAKRVFVQWEGKRCGKGLRHCVTLDTTVCEHVGPGRYGCGGGFDYIWPFRVGTNHCNTHADILVPGGAIQNKWVGCV